MMMQKPVSSQIPRGVGCPPPPGMDPRKGKGKLMCIKVRMLDDTVGVFHLGHKAMGQALFDEVCRHLNLLESDYFGLEFIDSYGNRCWLDKEKPILRQIMAAQSDARFFFVVKFYTPNPAELEEEYTRYLFALQLRRDLCRGELLCNENTAALLVSYIVQSECGDFSAQDYPDHTTYLSGSQFVPNQSPAFQLKVMEHHKKLIGMSPAEADFQLLETARRCDFYGIRLHNARDLEGIEIALSVAHMGIKMFHQMNCAMTFSWAKVRKLSFKRKRLMIKIHPDSNQQYKETIEFLFENRDDCKNFWKKCVEHHSFFRCPEPVEPRRDSSRRIFHRGSHFHYQGRTQKQLIDYVREHRKRREPFERPLRRSGINQSTAMAAANPNGGQIINNNNNHYQQLALAAQQQQRAMFVSDRMAGEYRLDGIAPMNDANANQTEKYPYIQNWPTTATTNALANGNGGKKARPKSALLDNGTNNHHNHHQKPHQQQQRLSRQDNHQPQPIMQTSCYGAILSTNTNANGIGRHHHRQQQQQGSHLTDDEQQQHYLQSAAFHQQMDPMSMSLPNVLAPSALQTDNCCFYAPPLKSMSGENFHVMEQQRREQIDNQSEGSYRLAGGDSTIIGGGTQLNSSQSDVGGSSNALRSAGVQPVDPRLYQTTFTTKRVGNVIVKKVTSGKNNGGNTGEQSQHSHHQQQSYRQKQQPHPQQQQPKPFSPSSSSSILAAVPASTSSMAIQLDGFNGAGGGVPSGCSSVCCSDYSLASSSAPASARNTAAADWTSGNIVASGIVGRLRYAAPANGSSGGLPRRLRHEIPVAIDGPAGNRYANGGNSASAGATPIIRPVLLPSPPAGGGRRQSASSSTSANSTPSQIQQQNGGGGARRPLVLTKMPSADFGGGGNSSSTVTTTKIVPLTKVNPAAAIGQTPTKVDEETNARNAMSPKTVASSPSGSGGPIPGRVVRNEDLVITTNGIGLKSAVVIPTQKVNESKEPPTPMEEDQPVKPKVPPKPADLQQQAMAMMTIGGGSKQTLEEGKATMADQRLLDPLESILKDVQSMQEALGDIPSSAGGRRQQIPTAISIQHEERPELRTVHLFNGGEGNDGDGGGGQGVPYTLTVRDVSRQRRTGTEEANGKHPNFHTTCEHAGGRHSKSIELVHRRRLPSQDSYSSQDHSISPTSPDSGNVLEYLLRKRSQSSDRAVVGTGGQAQQKSTGLGSGKGRRAERRLTQPIELGRGMKENVAEEQQKDDDKTAAAQEENAKEEPAATKEAQMAEKLMEEQTKPPIAAETTANEAEVKRLLETDF